MARVTINISDGAGGQYHYRAYHLPDGLYFWGTRDKCI